MTVHKNRSQDGGLIVDEARQEIQEDQEQTILRLCRADPNAVIVLQNGAPIDMTAWVHGTGAVLEAWYAGEQGAKALAETLFGDVNPSAKLPICIPKSVGQLPLFYAHKPSGRGYAYCDDDGEPLYPFGFGMSYTTFSVTDAALRVSENAAEVECSVTNTGDRAGTQVVQLYVGSHTCSVVRPVKELKAYRRVMLQPGETKRVLLRLEEDAFSYYDRDMVFGLHDGTHTLFVGTSSQEIAAEFAVRVRDGKLLESK